MQQNSNAQSRISDSFEEETQTKCEEQKAFQIKLLPTTADDFCLRSQKNIIVRKNTKTHIKRNIKDILKNKNSFGR